MSGSYTDDVIKRPWSATRLYSVIIFLFIGAMLYFGTRNHFMFANSHHRMVPIYDKYSEATGRTSGHFYLRVRVIPENFPAISRDVLSQLQQRRKYIDLEVPPRYYKSVETRDVVNIEYAERGGKLYARRANGHAPSWLYYVFAVFGLLAFRKTRL